MRAQALPVLTDDEIENRTYLTEKQAAKLLGLSPRTLQRLRRDGYGPPFVRLSPRRIGYIRAGIDEWAKGKTAHSTSEPRQDPAVTDSHPALNEAVCFVRDKRRRTTRHDH